MRRFSLYHRNGIYYVRFWNSEKRSYTNGVSTRQRRKNAALAVVALWDRDGIPEKGNRSIESFLHIDTLFHYARHAKLTPEHAERLIDILQSRGLLREQSHPTAKMELYDFLSDFRDYETSDYVREKKSYGHSIGKRYCCEQTGRLHHWNAFFPEGIRLCGISKEHLKKFQRYLREKVAAKTANSVLTAGTVEFSWAYEHGILIDNPGKELKKFSGESKKRGILSLNKPAHFLHSFGMMNVLELGTL